MISFAALATGRLRARLLALGVLMTPALAAAAATPPDPDACAAAPSFSDDFATADLGDRWQPLQRPAAKGPKDELQAYSPSNVVQGGGRLRLIARKEGRGAFSSGRIHSTTNFQYGCFEVTARSPAGPGLWPAIWLRTTYGKPINGEIDLFEGFGSRPGVFQSTLHRWNEGKDTTAPCVRLGRPADEDFGRRAKNCDWRPSKTLAASTATGFHRYGLIWTPQRVTWLLDREPYFTLTQQLPSRPMTLVINLAVGGVFDGPPTSATRFPAEMTVESVRYWPLATQGPEPAGATKP